MTVSVTITAPPSLPTGTYSAIFQGLLEKMSRDGDTFLIWMFLVATKEGQLEVTGASSEKRGPKSKAFRWFGALLGRRPMPGETLGDNLVGRPCLLVIEQDEEGFSNVTDVSCRPREPTAYSTYPRRLLRASRTTGCRSRAMDIAAVLGSPLAHAGHGWPAIPMHVPGEVLPGGAAAR